MSENSNPKSSRRKATILAFAIGGPTMVAVVAVFLLLGLVRKWALESQAVVTLKLLGNVIATYTSANNGGMPELAVLEEMSAKGGKTQGFWPFHDPRLPVRAIPVFSPGMTAAAKKKLAEEDCDFWYCGEGMANFNSAKDASSLVIFYDKGKAGAKRPILCADGHTYVFTAGSAELRELVKRNNELRRTMGLSLLPEDLMGPPVIMPATGSGAMTHPVP